MIDPISIALISGIVGGIVGAVVVTFWDEIAEFIKGAYEGLKFHIKESLMGMVAIAQMTVVGMKNVVKFYSYIKATKKWIETIESREVDESLVPEHIRNKVKMSGQADITDEVAKELKLDLV